MTQISLSDLFQAKAERRARLAALPIDEKIRIMEKLQEMGWSLRAARDQLRCRHSTDSGGTAAEVAAN